MRLWALDLAELGDPLRIAAAQFLQQVLPFALELTARNGETATCSRRSDPRGREAVAAICCVLMNAAQILTDAANRRRVRAKPKQLRVMLVALCLAPEHGLREERFPPESNQALGVEILRMKTPDPHRC